MHPKSKADMAQLVEHFIRNEKVMGSSPIRGSSKGNSANEFPFFHFDNEKHKNG